MPPVESGTPMNQPMPDDIIKALREKGGRPQGPRPKEPPPGLDDLDEYGRECKPSSTSTSSARPDGAAQPPRPDRAPRVNTPPPAIPVDIFHSKMAKTPEGPSFTGSPVQCRCA